MRRAFLPGILLVGLFLSTPPASGGDHGEELKSIGFLPFVIQAAQDLSYLREGIRDMLASRLAALTGATVVNMSGVNSPRQALDSQRLQSILEIGRTRRADFLVAGSLASGADGLSVEVDVYRTDNSLEPLSFQIETGAAGEVLLVIDQLALQMAEKLYGLKKEQPRVTRGTGATDQQPGVSPSPSAHPERSFLAPNAEIP